jgi:hypothetical protein
MAAIVGGRYSQTFLIDVSTFVRISEPRHAFATLADETPLQLSLTRAPGSSPPEPAFGVYKLTSATRPVVIG